ncbi:MAG: hypothetical protein H0U52_07275 [Chloroflexi bacterium]|nr:hypothetical protein [Chloroflexota bacterium]
MKRLVTLLILATSLVGCVSAGAVVTDPPTSTRSPTIRPVSSFAPVATSDTGAAAIGAVSASHPDAEAADVFVKCRIGDFIPMKQVAGMGKLPAGGDLTHYVPLTGREPELKEPGPVWVIQIRGDVSMGDQIWTDPICLVTNSEAGYMATGATTPYGTTKVTQPEAPPVPPDRDLPPLAP